MANPRKFSEKIALHNQKQAEETAEFEKIMKEVSDATSKPGSNSNDASKGPNSVTSNYRERPKSTLGPMRSRSGNDKRNDTSPYSSVYLSPPPDTGWRRTHSDSSLHTSTQEQILVQRRATVDNDVHFNTDPLRRNISSPNGQEGRSSTDLSRIQCSSFLTAQGEQIGKKIGSLPDLTSFHFPSPLDTPLDQEDRAQPCNNLSSGGAFNSFIGQQQRTSKFTLGSPPHEAPGPPQTPPQFSSQAPGQVCQQYVYQHPLSPLQPPSPQPVPPQQTSTLNSYRTPVSRPSPQASPSLSIRFNVGSPRSSSPQSPSSPASVSGGMSPFPDQTNYFINQQTNALQHHFEQFSMDDSCTQLTPDTGYFSTSPHFTNRVSTAVNTQTAPNTPSSIPDIVLTDFSNSDELAKDLGVAMVTSLESDLFPTDDCLRAGLDPIDFDGLQMLTDPDMITDSATEDHFRLDRL